MGLDTIAANDNTTPVKGGDTRELENGGSTIASQDEIPVTANVGRLAASFNSGPDIESVSGFWGRAGAYAFGRSRNGFDYDVNGKSIGRTPLMGLPPDFGIGKPTSPLKLARNIRNLFAAKGGSSWVYGAFKSEAKWAGQLSKRGWTAEQITEAVTKGKSFDAVNMVNKANAATRYVHPTTGQSVVIDNITKELLHVGGPGFKY